MVEMDTQKRVLWPMARVEELIPGKDGVIRTARVKTKSGSFLRPIQRLFPLEVDNSEFVPRKSEQPALDSSTEARKPEAATSQRTNHSAVRVTVTRHGRTVKKPQKLLD